MVPRRPQRVLQRSHQRRIYFLAESGSRRFHSFWTGHSDRSSGAHVFGLQPRKLGDSVATSRLPEERWSLFGIMLLAVTLMAGTILLWDSAVDQGEGVLFSSRIALFAVAGAFGGTLRSIVYLLAFPSLTPRERSQWRLEPEAVVAPILGAITGMLIYFLVVTAIVESPQSVSLEAQYLISLSAGALQVNQFGKWAERGLMRSALSRSGSLGQRVRIGAGDRTHRPAT